MASDKEFKESAEKLLLNRPNAKPKEERDEYDELYHEMRRRLAIERAIRDDQEAARGSKPRKITKIPPRRPGWYPIGE